MHPTLAKSAQATLSATGMDLIQLYTRCALALNAFDVAAISYSARTDEFQLSTTRRLPPQLRLPSEIDVVFEKAELIKRYRKNVLNGACEDFLIRMVSVLDACLEDIYAIALETLEPEVPERRRQSRIRGCWGTNDDGRTEIASYLVDKAGLINPAGKESTVDMVLDRYSEIREVRHALVHNGGTLSGKHKARLAELRDRLPLQLQGGSLANASFLQGAEIQLGLHEVAALRHWAYTTVLGYLREAFKTSEHGGAAT